VIIIQYVEPPHGRPAHLSEGQYYNYRDLYRSTVQSNDSNRLTSFSLPNCKIFVYDTTAVRETIVLVVDSMSTLIYGFVRSRLTDSDMEDLVHSTNLDQNIPTLMIGGPPVITPTLHLIVPLYSASSFTVKSLVILFNVRTFLLHRSVFYVQCVQSVLLCDLGVTRGC
jgi:hypothetical protein